MSDAPATHRVAGVTRGGGRRRGMMMVDPASTGGGSGIEGGGRVGGGWWRVLPWWLLAAGVLWAALAANERRVMLRWESGLAHWAAWLEGKPTPMSALDKRDWRAPLVEALLVLQGSSAEPLDALWLRPPNWEPTPPVESHFDWGRLAARFKPGRLWVSEAGERWREVDTVVLTERRHEQTWRRHLPMDEFHQRFPHHADAGRFARIYLTEELAGVAAKLADDRRELALAELYPQTGPTATAERGRRLAGLGWLLLALGWMAAAGRAVLRRAIPRTGSAGTGWAAALAVGGLLEVALLWAVGALGWSLTPWAWRLLHVPLLGLLWLPAGLGWWRRRRRGGLSAGAVADSDEPAGGATGGRRWRGGRLWAAAGVLVLAGLLMVTAGPGPLFGAPGVARDGFKGRIFAEAGMVSPALLGDGVHAPTAPDNAFLRPGYPPGWAVLAAAVALWAGGWEVTPVRALPALMLALALIQLRAAAWLLTAGPGERARPGREAWSRRGRRGFLLALLAAMAISPPVFSYSGRFYSEPWLLLLLATAWCVWLAAAAGMSEDRAGGAGDAGDRRLPWRALLLGAVLLGALTWVKREGVMWAGLTLVALPLWRLIDLRRWCAAAVVVAAMTMPVVVWRLSLGAGLEDFSWQAWGHWQEQRWERLQQTVAELGRWIWGERWSAFGLVVPVAAGLWLGRALVAATRAWRRRAGRDAEDGGRRRATADLAAGSGAGAGFGWLALVLVAGGLPAVVAMFQFSEVDSLGHHLTAVNRLLLPAAAAAWLLAALALAPGGSVGARPVPERAGADGAGPAGPGAPTVAQATGHAGGGGSGAPIVEPTC